jgi:hypothetical protein
VVRVVQDSVAFLYTRLRGAEPNRGQAANAQYTNEIISLFAQKWTAKRLQFGPMPGSRCLDAENCRKILHSVGAKAISKYLKMLLISFQAFNQASWGCRKKLHFYRAVASILKKC